MAEAHAVALADDDGRYKGLIKSEELLAAACHGSLAVRLGEAFSADPACIAPETSVQEALTTMAGAGTDLLAVVQCGDILGLLSREVLLGRLIAASKRPSALPRALQSFVAFAAHDLRSPLCLISSVVDIVSGSAQLSPTNHNFLNIAGRAARRGLGVVDSLLEIERYVVKGKVKRRTIALKDFIAKLRDEYAPIATLRRLSLLIDTVADGTGRFDPVIVQRALQNLLDNAIKHGRPGGEIRLSARRAANDRLEFIVADSGPGIDDAHLKTIFKPFVTVSPRQDAAGYGLGLAIVKRCAELHGGTITVTSKSEQGARFVLNVSQHDGVRVGANKARTEDGIKAFASSPPR